MQRILIGIVFVCFLLSACQDLTMQSHSSSPFKTHLVEKAMIPTSFYVNQNLRIQTQHFSKSTVWYNDDSFLYIADKNGSSVLHRYHLWTGKDEVFLTVDSPISNVKVNANRSLFAIRTVSAEGQPAFKIVNQHAKIIYQWHGNVNSFKIFWNPYKPQEMLILSYLPNWSVSIKKINLNEDKIEKLQVVPSYVQWTGLDEVGYFKKESISSHLYAPIYRYDFSKKKELLWLKHVTGFFSFDGVAFAVSAIPGQFTDSVYSFYDLQSYNKIDTFKVPFLNTYSEMWWIPYHDFSKKNGIFYYFRPKESGNVYDYKKGFDLVARHLKKGTQEVILETENNVRLNVSPDGTWALYGHQLEQVVHLPTGTTWSLRGE